MSAKSIIVVSAQFTHVVYAKLSFCSAQGRDLMYRVKQLFGGSLTLRDYDGQVAEALTMVRALNKMTKAGMPESVRIA